MKARARSFSTHMLALLLCVSVAFAQTTELGPVQPAPAQTAPAQPGFTQQELDQMLAPIALYPDSLLSQILMASTYPIEIVQAARWSRANPNLKGDDAVRAVEQNNWDPSVKSLVAFPQILSMMDEKLDWMERLGDAFLSQQQQVMDTVQDLRQKAQAAGNLRSNEIVRVEPQGQTIIIEQANPQVVYVPYYNPTVVYGPWWWADYPPVYWGPWPGYYERPGFGAGFFWGAGITLGVGFFFGAFDWPHRHASIVNVNNYYYRPGPRYVNGTPGGWEHDPGHRRGVPYRDPVLRQQFGRHDARPDTRREYRGNESYRTQGPGAPGTRPDARNGPDNRPEQRERVRRDAGGNARPNGPDAGRPESRNVPTRPDVRDVPSRPNLPDVTRTEPRSAPTRPSAGTAPGRPNALDVARAEPRSIPARPTAPVAVPRPNAEPRPHIFEGVGRGPVVRDSSVRGHSSERVLMPGSNAAPASPPPGNISAPRPGGNASPPQRPGNNRNNDKESRQQR